MKTWMWISGSVALWWWLSRSSADTTPTDDGKAVPFPPPHDANGNPLVMAFSPDGLTQLSPRATEGAVSSSSALTADGCGETL